MARPVNEDVDARRIFVFTREESLKHPEILRNKFHGVFFFLNLIATLNISMTLLTRIYETEGPFLNNRITNNGKTYWKKMLITFLFYL